MDPSTGVSALAVTPIPAAERTGGGSPEDRAELPAGGTAWSASLTVTETILAELWGELLGAGRVSALDTFFRLGGDSLLATRMGFAVRRALGVALPTDVLFEAWTLRRLAAWIDGRRRVGHDAGPPPLVRVPRDGPLPLTMLQEFHWMQHQFAPDSASSNMPYAMRVGGAVLVPALERAVSEVVRRHEALRTTFPAPLGVPVQVVGPPGPVRIPVVDLSALPAAAREREALRQAGREAARPFDCRSAPSRSSTAIATTRSRRRRRCATGGTAAATSAFSWTGTPT
jgi:hypothetical protein